MWASTGNGSLQKSISSMKVDQNTIVIYDGNHHGHHPTYQKLIAKMLLENGYRVWLICSGVDEVVRWLQTNVNKDLLKRLVARSALAVPGKNYWEKQLWAVRTWRYAARTVRRLEQAHSTQPGLVLFLKLDDFTKGKGILNGSIIDYLFPYAWAGIYIHLRFPGKRKNNIVNRCFYQPFTFAKSKKLKAIGILQEDAEKQLAGRVSKPIVVLPDFTDETAPTATELTERIKNTANGKKIIGLIGGQDRRKGSFLFFDIAKRCAQKNWLFVFAGKMNYPKSDRELAELQALIGDETKWENCFFHFERIPNESDFNAVIETCDALFAVYRNFPFSSNLMTKASVFHKPIVVCSGGLMETRVRQYGIGTSCSPEDPDDCIRAIESALSHPNPTENYEHYAAKHSSTRFLNLLQTIIHSAVG